MDFSWTMEQDELYRNSVDFACGWLNRHVKGVDEPEAAFREAWKRCGDQGIFSVAVPQEQGGLGLGALSSARVMEALGYGCRDMGFVFSLAAHLYACIVPLLYFGDHRVKSRYLPGMISGDLIATHCVTEPQAGSDAFGMKTRAERRGDRYILNGSKCFASNAPVADVFLIHATTNPKLGFMGLSAFLIERGTKGLSVSKPYAKLGLNSAPLGDVFLEDCEVPADQLLGSEGQGGTIFTHSMNWERACLFASYLGAMQRQLEETIRYANERRQFNRPIKDFQAVSHTVAEMKVRLEASRMLVYRAAWLLDKDASWKPSPDSAIAKLFVSEAAVQSALDAIQLRGGMGIMVEAETERYLRDAVPGRIFSGTSEIQRNNIARALGL